VLTEHLREPYLKARFGRDNFSRADEAQRLEMMQDVERMARVTMAGITPWLDLESLTRWFVSIAFCATTDPFQAVMFRDDARPDARWFWVNWDMDHSFMDLYERADEPWNHDTFRTTLAQSALESRVIARLIADDPAYRALLTRRFLDALNHQVTPAFLLDRYGHYALISKTYGVRDVDYLEPLLAFLQLRPTRLRELMTHYLELRPMRQLRLEAPEGVTVLIDDFVESSGFSGWYPEGTEVVLSLREPREDFSRWSVNGRTHTASRISHRVESDTVVALELRDGGRPAAGNR
jgi:hypothetical protein